jgi:hypothetical protein
MTKVIILLKSGGVVLAKQGLGYGSFMDECLSLLSLLELRLEYIY